MTKENAATMPSWTGNNENYHLSVSRTEIEGRRDAALEKMRRSGIDVAIFTSPDSIFYLTGINLPRMSYHPFILSSNGQSRVLCRNIDAGWTQIWPHQTWASDWVVFRDQKDSAQLVADAINDTKPNGTHKPTIGFELDRASISYSAITRISELADAGKIVSCTAVVEQLRVVKSPAELQLMRRAGKISGLASDAIIEAIRAGATDMEASIAAGKVVNELSGTPRPAPTVMTGALGGNGHMMAWSKHAPKPGDAVTWYVSGFVHNYACPLERTLVKGPDTQNILPMIDTVARCVETLVSELKPGMKASQAYEIALRAHTESGVVQYWRNHAGYGTGINWVEFDLFRLRPDDDRVLQPGMALHLVPCLTIPGLTNVQGSRVIAITDNGVDELSDYPLRLGSF